jgi:hypothetical protein
VDLSVTVIIAKDVSTEDQLPAAPRRRVVNRSRQNMSSDNAELMDSLTEEAEVGRLEHSLDALKNSDETIRHTEIGWMSRKTESESFDT